MANRPRISITLHEPWRIFLDWLALYRGELPAELARGLLETALEQTRADPAIRQAYEMYLGGGGDNPQLVADVAAAMMVEGVPHILAGDFPDAPAEASRAARFLSLLARWLGDARPPAEKGPAPRLSDVRGQARDRTPIGPALAYTGGADGAAIRQAARGGRLGASDKPQLSDTALVRGGEVRNEWT